MSPEASYTCNSALPRWTTSHKTMNQSKSSLTCFCLVTEMKKILLVSIRWKGRSQRLESCRKKQWGQTLAGSRWPLPTQVSVKGMLDYFGSLWKPPWGDSEKRGRRKLAEESKSNQKQEVTQKCESMKQREICELTPTI